YVIVFTHFSGGAIERLLSATPLLMLGQMIALPLYLWLFVGKEFVRSVEFAPFLQVFGYLIVLPLLAASFTQFMAARTRWGAKLAHGVSAMMGPLMMTTLAVIVASYTVKDAHQRSELGVLVQLYAGFARVMAAVGTVLSRLTARGVASHRAAIFSGVTSNSLVILPFVLALP